MATGMAGPEAVLDELLQVPGVVSAALVDVDSGMALAVRAESGCRADLELLTAAQADLVRTALIAARALYRAGPPTELLVSHGTRLHHLLRPVPDPSGDRLGLAILVAGSAGVLWRARWRLRRVSMAGLVPPSPADRPLPLPAPVPPAGSVVVPGPRAADPAARPGIPLVPRPAGELFRPAEPQARTTGAAGTGFGGPGAPARSVVACAPSIPRDPAT